ncbi:MAG: hypothetical protein L6V89_11215 [Oscillospiraceae bacterium]|nr:MAG: hypothetical protein L6V89_11215 [Oscillospiraceae bacterium]
MKCLLQAKSRVPALKPDQASRYFPHLPLETSGRAEGVAEGLLGVQPTMITAVRSANKTRKGFCMCFLLDWYYCVAAYQSGQFNNTILA